MTVPSFGMRPGSFPRALACLLLATLAACMGELRRVPSQLMRPRPPRAGRRVFLERVAPLWRRMTFMQKVAVRNLRRDAIEKLKAMKLATAVKTVEEGIRETLTYTGFPREHWRKLRTSGPPSS